MLIGNTLYRIMKGFLLNNIAVFDELFAGKGKEFGGTFFKVFVAKVISSESIIASILIKTNATFLKLTHFFLRHLRLFNNR